MLIKLLTAFAVAAPLLYQGATFAQTAPWPNKPVKVIVSGAAGSGTDPREQSVTATARNSRPLSRCIVPTDTD